MPLRIPPPEVGIVNFLSPNKSDQGLIEFWDTLGGSYTPLDIGSPHPDARQYPNFRLGKQSPQQGDERWVIRTWVTDETNPDWFNWAEKFAGEDAEFPTFVRTYREPRNSYVRRTEGTSLKTIYKLVVTDAGSGYTTGTYPKIVFDAPTVAPTTEALAHGVVAPDGTISECVLDFGGEGYAQDVEFTVDSPVNGNPASGIAYVQPQTAILTREEASLFPEDSPFYAQYLQVVRVYETIPGPTFNETRLDIDGAELDIATTRKLCSEIDTGETINGGTWCKTTSKPTDIDVICEEEVACRPIPGNPMVSTKIDEDGKVITRTQTYTATADCVSEETLPGGTSWVKKYIEDVDGTNLVSWQWIESRDIPGNDITEETIDERDGAVQTVVRVMSDASSITPIEEIGFTDYIKIEAKPISDLVAWKVTTSRPIPGNDVVKTVIDDAGDEVEETRTLFDYSIVTTITTAGGVYTKTFQEPITDILAWKVVQVKLTQNELDSFELEVLDIIPAEFKAALPVTTTEQTLIGQASLPTLVAGDLMRREAQIDFNTYRLTIRGRPDLSYPVVILNFETTEEYGGGILGVAMTLHNAPMLPDEGLLVVTSEVKTLGAGLFLKTTRILDDTQWPILTEYDQDPEVQSLITTTYQVVDATAVAPPSIVNGVITRYKKIDKWRSLQIVETYSLPADYEEQRFMAQTFPSLWDTTTYNYSTACGATGPIRHGFSTMVQARMAISFSTAKETISGLTLIPNTHHLVHDIINAVLNDGAVITYTGACSGPIFITPSSPTYTTYITTIQNTEQLITGESVLWRAGLYKNTRLYVTML